MKKALSIVLCIMLLASCFVQSIAVFAAGTPKITCQDVTCNPGDVITVSVDVTNNPGFMYLEMSPDFPEELTFSKFTNGKLVTDFTPGTQQYIWLSSSGDVTADGNLGTIEFTVPDNTPVGEYKVGFILRTCGNAAEKKVDMQVVEGTVKVTEPVAEVYNVAASNPMIPLYEGKKIKLDMLSIEVNGAAKSGKELTWTKAEGDSAGVDGNYLLGKKVGNTVFNVSDGANTQQVLVVVNAKGDKNFALLNLDFTKDGAFNEADWIQGFASDANSTTGDENLMITGKYKLLEKGVLSQTTVTTAQGETKALYFPAASGHGQSYAAIYKYKVLDNFSNYKITVKASNQQTFATQTNNMSAAPGVLARVTANYDAKVGDYIFTEDKSMAFRFRNYGAMSLFGISTYDLARNNTDYDGDGKTDWVNVPLCKNPGNKWSFFTEGDVADYYRPSTASPSTYVPETIKTFFPDARDAALTVKTIDIELGSNMLVKYSLNNNLVFNCDANNVKYKSMALKFGDGDWDGALAASDTNLSNYAAVFPQNMVGKCSKFPGSGSQHGTVGLMNNNGNNYYIYSIVVVPLDFDSSKLPAMTNIDGTKVTAVPVNHRINLSEIDSAVTWTDVRTDAYEVKNGVMMAYSGAGTKVKVAGTKSSAPFTADVSILAFDGYTDLDATQFADEAMTVKPQNTANTDYQVKISRSFAVVDGTLKVTANGQTTTLHTDIGDGCTYAFNTALADKMVLTAEYISYEDAITSLTVLQAWAREATDKVTDAIRFQNKIPALVKKNNTIGFVTDKIEVDGKEVTLQNVGALVIPEALLGKEELKVPDNQLDSFDPVNSALVWVNGQKAANIPITKLSTANESYSEAYVTIADLKTIKDIDAKDVELTTVCYVQYVDGEGNMGYIYSKPYTKSFNDVGAAAYPFDENSADLEKLIIKKGTDHDLDTSASTNDLNYALNQDITFTCEVDGTYTVYWELFKDNAKANVISGETYKEADKTNCINYPVKTGSSRTKATVTTQMKTPGTVRCVFTIKKADGTVVKYQGGDARMVVVAAADYENIVQPLEVNVGKPTSYKSSTGATVNMTTDEFIDSMRTTFDAQVNAVGGTLDSNSTAIADFISSATVGSAKTIGSVMKLECTKVATGYKLFAFTIATDSSVGINYTSSDYNKRPATGVFKIPTSSITGVSGYYSSWGGFVSGTTDVSNSQISSNLTTNTTPIWVASDPNGVNPKGSNPGYQGLLDNAEKSVTDPTKSYAYGMIFRDYLGLQIGKRLYKYIVGSAPTQVCVTGTSQGGFQSYLVNALDKSVNCISTDVAWMCSVGQETTDNILSQKMPCGVGTRYFSSVSAAQYIAKTINDRPSGYTFKIAGSFGDETAPISGVIALYNAFKNCNCRKQLAISQFKGHSAYPFSWSTTSYVTQIKNF